MEDRKVKQSAEDKHSCHAADRPSEKGKQTRTEQYNRNFLQNHHIIKEGTIEKLQERIVV